MLITRVLDPHRLNAQELASLHYDFARKSKDPQWDEMPEAERMKLLDYMQFTLDALVRNGTLGT